MNGDEGTICQIASRDPFGLSIHKQVAAISEAVAHLLQIGDDEVVQRRKRGLFCGYDLSRRGLPSAQRGLRIRQHGVDIA